MKLLKSQIIYCFLLLIVTFTVIPYFFGLFLKISPFLLIPFLFFISKKKKKTNLQSESIFKKRIRKFKSIKRGYYSLIIIIILYALSLLTPLWMNNKALMICYANKTWDEGESFIDQNQNGKWDDFEDFTDEHNYYFPALWDFLDFIPGINYPVYEAKSFNQKTTRIEVDFRLLNKTLTEQESDNYVIMPFYQYHPHEDLKDELDEQYTDSNQNGKWDEGEIFVDQNQNGKWDEINPPTLPDGLSGRHIIGTDNTGRDVFSRLVDGYKISITFAIIVTTLGYIIGISVGAFLGYFAGKWDLFGVRFMEVFSAVPFLFMMMILASFIKPGVLTLALLSVFLKAWIGITYYIRGEFFREKAKDYVSAAVSMGQSNWKIMFKHILPNSLTPIITFAPFSIIADIFTLVSLDFLGYGLRPPASSWGNLLQQASENLDNWHMLIFPVIVLTLTIFMITFISEAIREAFDPRVYSRLR